MKVTWGKPLIEFGKVGPAGANPETWDAMPTQQEGTVQLTTNAATPKELYGEGHELVARKNDKPSYELVMEVFIEDGDERPIETDDGIVKDNYAVRLTPEDDTLTGFIFENSQVEAEELWSSDEGTKVRYTFTALVPATGAMFKTYTKV